MTWATTPDGQLAHRWAQTGEWQRLARCDDPALTRDRQQGRAVCLFPEGGTLIKAGGLCNDLHGACLSLQATVAALRELALTEQREALAAALQSAAETVQVALQALLPSERH